jgi:hypothetical protein
LHNICTGYLLLSVAVHVKGAEAARRRVEHVGHYRTGTDCRLFGTKLHRRRVVDGCCKSSQHPPASRVHGVEPDVFDLEPALEAAAAAAAAAVHNAALVPMKFEIIDGSELKKLGVQLQEGAAVDVRHVGDVEGGVVAAKGVRRAENTGVVRVKGLRCWELDAGRT